MSEFASQESLIHRYGLKFNRDFPCVSNVLVNKVRILKQDGQADLYFVENGINHAYVVCERTPLNVGVTTLKANPKYFPDFPVSYFENYCEEKTLSWFEQTLEAFFDNVLSDSQLRPYEKRHEFAKNRIFVMPCLLNLESAFKGEELISAVNLMRHEYLNLMNLPGQSLEVLAHLS